MKAIIHAQHGVGIVVRSSPVIDGETAYKVEFRTGLVGTMRADEIEAQEQLTDDGAAVLRLFAQHRNAINEFGSCPAGSEDAWWRNRFVRESA